LVVLVITKRVTSKPEFLIDQNKRVTDRRDELANLSMNNQQFEM